MVFSFDAETHTYRDQAGVRLPNITGMLADDGLIEPWWFTEEARIRGDAVHELAAAYDLEALDVESCTSPYRGWLLAHVKAMTLIPHDWQAIEEPVAHPQLRFAGTPDRVGKVYGAWAVLDLKSGLPCKSHPIQTALQAVLVSHELKLPAPAIDRYTLYLQANGRFRLEQHRRRHDLTKALELIRRYCT